MARHRPAAEVTSDGSAVRWIVPVTFGLIAFTGLALLAVVMGPHRIGDYFTETDFYGGYAAGATLIQHGHLDAARYGVVGPVYEIALALVGALTHDLFIAAEAISIIGAVASLALWFMLLARRTQPAFAMVAIAFLAANPTFFRYGYSATTDMLAFALEAAALFAVLASRRASAPLIAGALAALAALTRYSAVVLLPGALLSYAWLAPRDDMPRRRAIAMFLTGFSVVALPWLVFALRSGAPPAAQLFHDIAFDIYASARGHTWAEYQSRMQPGFRSFLDVWRRDPAAVVTREGANLVSHVGEDARRLLGWPVALLCVIGAIFAFVDRAWRKLAPVLAIGGLYYVALIPAFYSERYALALAPFYLALAGCAALSPWLWRHLRAGALPLLPVMACAALAFSIVNSVAAQRAVLETVPLEVLPVARTLRADAPAGASVMALKSQIAFNANLAFVPMPATGELAVLANECRERRVDYLYYSWLEANNRPSFWMLLDPAAELPGLERVRYEHGHPAALYRILPAFGAMPAWFDDDSARARSAARVVAEIPPAWKWRTHLSIAVAALERRRYREALDHAAVVTRDRPGEALGWRLSGDARLQLNDARGAIADFERALALEPANAETRIALGWLLLAYGEQERAAAVWKPAIPATSNRAILERMIELFHARGDADAEQRARDALDRAQR
jgi:4-amino-4-deoxy-L-arabinose transferase-like glycosyltransferase